MNTESVKPMCIYVLTLGTFEVQNHHFRPLFWQRFTNLEVFLVVDLPFFGHELIIVHYFNQVPFLPEDI